MSDDDKPIDATKIQPGDWLLTSNGRVLVTAVCCGNDAVKVWVGRPDPYQFDHGTQVLVFTAAQRRERDAWLQVQRADEPKDAGRPLARIGRFFGLHW